MPFADTNGVKMYYERRGAGPDVLAISGLLSTTVSSQFHFVPGLADAFHLVLGDHRGNGQSDVPPPPYTIDEIADDWVALMDHLGIDRAPVVGNSMGSMIATSLVLRYPERVSGLVLSVPASHADPFLEAVVEHWLDVYLALGSRGFSLETLLWTLTPAGFNAQAPVLRQVLAGELPEIPQDGFRGQVAALVGFDERDHLGEIDVPTLIIAGTEDRVCHPAHAQAYADGIPHAELVWIDGAGHLPQTERPEQYAAALLPFLDSITRSV